MFGIVDKRKNLPHAQGVYFLLIDKKVEYIGMSIDIKQRLMTHHRKDLVKKSRIMYIEMPDKSEYEIRQIERKWQNLLL